MSDLRAVLNDANWAALTSPDVLLAALAAADEPLVATVEVLHPVDHDPNDPTAAVGYTSTATIVCLTEDVLRERLRDPSLDGLKLHDSELDAIVRAILGGDR